MTPEGLAALKRHEGRRLTAYPDPYSPLAVARREGRRTDGLSGAPWTVGYGCTGPDIGPTTVWSAARAEAELLNRVGTFEIDLKAAFPWFTTLDPVRRDVLTNLAFNLGVQGLKLWPVTLSDFESHDFPAAALDIANNRKWHAQVGARADDLAHATLTGSWSDSPPKVRAIITLKDSK